MYRTLKVEANDGSSSFDKMHKIIQTGYDYSNDLDLIPKIEPNDIDGSSLDQMNEVEPRDY